MFSEKIFRKRGFIKWRIIIFVQRNFYQKREIKTNKTILLWVQKMKMWVWTNIFRYTLHFISHSVYFLTHIAYQMSSIVISRATCLSHFTFHMFRMRIWSQDSFAVLCQCCLCCLWGTVRVHCGEPRLAGQEITTPSFHPVSASSGVSGATTQICLTSECNKIVSKYVGWADS